MRARVYALFVCTISYVVLSKEVFLVVLGDSLVLSTEK